MQFRIRLVAAAAVLAAAGIAQAAVAFDANLELDLTTHNGDTSAAQEGLTTGGRVEINANAELVKSGDNFVNARASLILPFNGDNVTMDDVWLQLGNSAMDLKIGRFEATDLFPVAKDTVLDYAETAGYHANTLRGRFKDGRTHMSAGFNAGSGLRFELGLVSEKKDNSALAYGLRPLVTYNAGALTLRAGLEAYKATVAAVGEVSYTGAALSAGYALAKDASVNANYATLNGDGKVADASSIGLNLVYGPAGIGYIRDTNKAFGTAGEANVDTIYAAYSFPLMGVKGATITPAFSISKGETKDLTALRVRFNYAF